MSQFAAVVLELARLRPYRRRRFRGLQASHPELRERLIAFDIIEDFPTQEEWGASEEEPARVEGEWARPCEQRDLTDEDFEIPF